ncbi:MAG TPA: Yip1 family protein [Gaiellaceae bacterium]|nr:Yip1 family protein [Gaiellaceae bacterium]
MRDWWLRTLLVLQRPRAVFVALRDDSKESRSDRSEQVLLIVLLAGIASVLSTHTAAHLMDSSDFDNVLVAIWAFLAGGLYGLVAYYAFGALLHGGVKALGSQGTYLRTRHVLAFASVPVALSLVLWPVKLALYGDALFRAGGGDAHSGGKAFAAAGLVFVAWSAALLVTGVRAVHGWTWARSLAACGLALAPPAAIAVALAAR